MDANNPLNNQDPNTPAPLSDPGASIAPQEGVVGAQVIEPAATGAPAVAATTAPLDPLASQPAPSVEAQPLSGVTAPMPGSEMPMTAQAPSPIVDQPTNFAPASNPIPGAAPIPPSAPNAVYPAPGANAPVDVPMGKPAAFMDPAHQSQPGVSGKSGKGKLGKILLIVLVVLFVLGGGGAYAFVTTQKNKPESVTGQAIANLMASKQTAMDGTLKYSSADNKVGVEIGFAGKQDGKNGEISISVNGIKTDVLTFDAAKLGVTVRVVDDNAYFKIDNLKAFVTSVYDSATKLLDPAIVESYKPLKAQVEGVADKIGNKWVEIPKKELEENDLDCLPDREISPADQKQIVSLYKQHRFFTIKKNHGVETVDGVKNNHYTANINTDKADAFGEGVAKMDFAKKIKDCTDSQKSNQKDPAGADAPIQESDDPLKFGDIDYWVTKNGRDMSRITIPASDDSGNGTFDVKLAYGAAAKIDKPSETMTLEEFMQLYEKALTDAGLGDDASPVVPQDGFSGIVNGLRTDIPNIIQPKQ